ncbi:unnamed protein product [Auanema sp. JU1783]|nr:unnamed protein product [Auanema sp. JU1783]
MLFNNRRGLVASLLPLSLVSKLIYMFVEMSDSRRKRSRSRSPVRSHKSAPVNMLDPEALASLGSGRREKKPRNDNSSFSNPKSDRDRGSINDRGNGRNYQGGNRYDNRRNFPDNNRRGIRNRLSYSNDRRSDEHDDKKNGLFRESDNKPVQVLVDPTAVPRAKAFFTHDDRGGDDRWRGRNAYDPRIDFGPRRERRGEIYGYRRNERQNRYDKDWQSRDKPRPNKSYREPSKADGMWTHDLYDGEDKKDKEEDINDKTKVTEERGEDEDNRDKDDDEKDQDNDTDSEDERKSPN